MADVTLGGTRAQPRAGAALGSLASAFTNLSALLFRGAAADHQGDERDRRLAERGARLHRLMTGDAPTDIYEDVNAIFVEHFDDVLEKVMDGELPAECLAVLRNLAALIDKEWVLGAQAMRRLADKRLVSAQAIATHKAEATAAATPAA